MLMQLDKLQAEHNVERPQENLENSNSAMNELPWIQEDHDSDGGNEIKEQFMRFSIDSEDKDREDEEGISIQLCWDMT